MENLNLDLKDTKLLLKNLKLYKDLTKKLGTRGKRVFAKLMNDKSYYLVEYYSEADLDYVKSKSLEIYKNYFGEDLKEENIVFQKNDLIGGGIRVYKDDKVLDLSFKKVINELKK